MKVRIGVSIGRGGPPEVLDEVCDAIEQFGFDSLWLSEVLTGGGPDPLVGLAWAAARYRTLKIGTTMLLPGRNVVRLAKSLATLDRLSAGRLLVTFVPGLTDSPEREAIGLEPRARGAAMDTVLPLLRSLLSGATTSSDAELASFGPLTLEPLPAQQPLEFWLGGMAPRALVRCGRLGDGWLPSFTSPERIAEGLEVIEEAAAAAGRTISPEHFGVSVPYVSRLDDRSRELVARRESDRPGEPALPVGPDGLARTLESFIDVGFSKFVVRPLVAPTSWQAELAELADGVGGLQT